MKVEIWESIDTTSIIINEKSCESTIAKDEKCTIALLLKRTFTCDIVSPIMQVKEGCVCIGNLQVKYYNIAIEWIVFDCVKLCDEM